MKKLICIVSVLTLIFTSCSNDSEISSNDASLTQEGTLLRRIIDEFGSSKDTVDINYSNGNKLKTIESKQQQIIKSEYTYTGDLITKKKDYASDGLLVVETYVYDDQERMIQINIDDLDSDDRYKKVDFVYNDDNTVKALRYKKNENSQFELIDSIKLFLLPNGDTQRKEQYIVINGVNHTRTSIYTYDDKNSATNSILGFKKIRNRYTGMSYSIQNVISSEYSTTEYISPTSSNSTYTYNSFGYPINVQHSNGHSFKYFYAK